MGRSNIRKEDILMRVNTYDIFRHFLKDKYDAEGVPMKPGVHIYVPEISGKQKSPSFNVYFSRRSNEYRYKDFTGHDGSAFDLVMNLYNASFTEAISIINKEMNLGLESEDIEYTKVKPKEEINVESDRNYEYSADYFNWTDKRKHAAWWARFGTSVKVLELYGWKPVKLLEYYSKKGELITIQDYNYKLIFAWERNGWGKYYMPEIPGIQKKRFGYFGKKEEGYVFGIEQLPEYGDDLHLIGGEKDVTNSRAHGMFSVCLTSEESHPLNYPSLMELIRSGRFKNCWTLYDLDKTGKRQSEKINNLIPELKPKILPIMEGDDISEYLIKQYKSKMF